MLKNPKWLNRRSENDIFNAPTLKSLFASEDVSKAVKKNLSKLRFLWFVIPLLIGVLVATPLGIIFNTTPSITPIPSLPPTLPIPPSKFVNTNTSNFDFDLKGWQPSSNQHFYGINRPTSPYNQDFQATTLFVPSSINEYGKEYLKNSNNAYLQSEYYSYSFDEDSFNQCSNDLLAYLQQRTALPDSDSNKITVPTGYSLVNLFNRIKYTYCTFYKPSRESLIEAMKNPYVNTPRLDVVSPEGDLIAAIPDNVYQKRDMWYEHDGSVMGERTYEFDFPSIFPETYRSRYKVPLNNKVLGYNLHSYNVKDSTILLDSRYALFSEIFYRYFLNSPFDDIDRLYEPQMRNRISDPNVVKKTLVRPGMGPDNTWEQNVYRDYSGDTSFRLLDKANNINGVVPGNQAGLIAIPENWDTTKELNYLWNTDFSASTNVAKIIMEAFESSNIGRIGSMNIDNLDMKNFLNYFLRATFDNSRNILLNDTFKSDASNTISSTNKMVLYDAYRFGPQRGLGRFYYESPRIANNFERLVNIDQETFEYDMFEENINSICASISTNNIYGTSVCPTTKVALEAKNGSIRHVYVPDKNNEVTEYYAELEEINSLWTFLYDRFQKILDTSYKNNLFTPFDDNEQNGNRRTQGPLFYKNNQVEAKRDNFKIFNALVELFRDSKVLNKFILPQQTSDTIKSNMNQLLLATIDSLNDLANEVLASGDITFTYSEFSTKLTLIIKNIQKMINYYAKVEATRKLDTLYDLKVVNSNGLEFNYQVQGRNLTYHLYVRYMKMNEARRKYLYDKNGDKRSFLIYEWDYDPTDTLSIPQYDTRSVTVEDATDSEMAYFIIHYLKDTRFPWIPLKFETPTKVVNVGKVYDLSLSNYSPKYDKNVKDAKEMINAYMNNLLFKDFKITNTQPPSRSWNPDSNQQQWVNFDVVKFDPTDNIRNELATYYERSNFTDGGGYTSNMFQEYYNTTRGLKDFVFYANAHYLLSPNRQSLENENENLAKTTHCIVTYESTGVKNELGYNNVLLPINNLDPNTQSNKLLDYFYVGQNGWRFKNKQLLPYENSSLLKVRSNVYTAPSFTYANTQGHLEKYLHTYFSKCISDEQYKNPLLVDDANYDPQNDEWSDMVNQVSLRIKWDLLDIQ